MNAAERDAPWMHRALELAARGEGHVEPNPMVGAVVLDAAGNRVGEGFHERFGGAHAEVHALKQAGPQARGGTLYVTLEPCCHVGKTPPCTRAVLASGLRRVVVAVLDPNPLVNGRGIAELKAANVIVTVGVGQPEAEALTAPFRKRQRTGRPWVIGKWAMTLDGKIATSTGDSRWISSPESRAQVHTLRGRVDAVLVGANTVRLDDPLLTARPPGPRTATRVVLTRSGNLPAECQLLRTIHEAPVLVFTLATETVQTWSNAGAEVVGLAELEPRVILDDLGRRGMTNVLVEGGAGVLGSFADSGELDEIWAFVAPKLVGGTGPSPVAGQGIERMLNASNWDLLEVTRCGPDLWLRGRRPA